MKRSLYRNSSAGVVGVLALVVLLTAGASSSSAAGKSPGTPAAPVPAQYQSLYTTVQAQLDEAQQTVERLPSHSTPGMVYGAALLFADGNRGTQLLVPQTLPEVNQEIDTLAGIGVRGVSIQVSFPLLLPSTVNSSRYLVFYEQVARDVAHHHMVLSVEENPVLVGTPFAVSANVSFAGLTDATYAQEQAQMAQIIVDDLHPAYLSLMTEPDTYATYIGLPDLNQPAASAAVVKQEVQLIKRGTTLLGAGAGSWSLTQFDQDYAATGVNYIDLHVYPTEPQFVANAVTDVTEAKAAHLPVVMDEFYLFPSVVFDGAGTIQKHEIEPFSWVNPLETQFLQTFTEFAQKEGIRYVDAFDSNDFIAKITWQPSDDTTSLAAVSKFYDPVLKSDLASGNVTEVGRAYREMIRSSS
jgi:hypothetical protein